MAMCVNELNRLQLQVLDRLDELLFLSSRITARIKDDGLLSNRLIDDVGPFLESVEGERDNFSAHSSFQTLVSLGAKPKHIAAH